MEVDLLIFDLDGTLVETYTSKLLPNVRSFFDLILRSGCSQLPSLALATNQGGVGLRYWMEQEGFGEPEEYPTEAEVTQRIQSTLKALDAQGEMRVYVSFRYQDREGQWSPIPEGSQEDPRYQKDWRKPNPGMLLQAIEDAGVPADRALYVGDSPEDREAAAAAGCRFRPAESFFAQPWRDCRQLEKI